MTATPCFIGLGSNLENPLKQLKKAVQTLSETSAIAVINSSSVYRSQAIGMPNQPDYLNAVIKATTTLSAEALLNTLQTIENHQGRIREHRWGARTLDLDILCFGDKMIHTERLTIPHPHIAERNFVLKPLYELAPDLQLADGRYLSELLHKCPHNPLTLTSENLANPN